MHHDRQTLPLADVFKALAIVSHGEYVTGLGYSWREPTGCDSLSSVDSELAATTLRQPPTKFGPTETPSLWSALHFLLALPALHYTLRHYGQEDAQTKKTVLSEKEIITYFDSFRYVIADYQEYRELTGLYGKLTKRWWGKELEKAFADIRTDAPLKEAIRALPLALQTKTIQVFHQKQDSLAGRIILSYLLARGFTPERLGIGKHVPQYFASLNGYPSKTLYERLVEAQMQLPDLHAILGDYAHEKCLKLGDFLALVEWFGKPSLVEAIAPVEMSGAGEPTVKALLALITKIITDGGPDYTNVPHTALMIEKFKATQSLASIGRLSVTLDVLSSGKYNESDGAILRQVVCSLYSDEERIESWGDRTHYILAAPLEHDSFTTFRQNVCNVLYCAGIFQEHRGQPRFSMTKELKELALDVQHAASLENMASLLNLQTKTVRQLADVWAMHYPTHERLRAIEYIEDWAKTYSQRPAGTRHHVKRSHADAPRIVCLCPTPYDYAELDRLHRRDGLAITYIGGNVDDPDFTNLAFVDETVSTLRAEQQVDGIFISDDGASIVGAMVADRLELPGPNPRVILQCLNKYRTRQLQQALPDLSIPFWLYQKTWSTDKVAALPYPLFAKPVRSYLSNNSMIVHSPQELQALIESGRDFMHIRYRQYNAFARHCNEEPIPDSAMLLEAILTGKQVTVDGYVWEHTARIIGITDSTMYPGTISFARFTFPSILPDHVQVRIQDCVTRLVEAIGLSNCLFNVEVVYDEAKDTIGIVEVNPRFSPQFADLFEKVLGVNTYEIALDISMGREPSYGHRRGAYACAASFVPRVFGARRVISIPSEHDVNRFYEEFPDGRLRVLCEPGEECGKSMENDMVSFRYAVINLGAPSFAELEGGHKRALALLPFSFDHSLGAIDIAKAAEYEGYRLDRS